MQCGGLQCTVTSKLKCICGYVSTQDHPDWCAYPAVTPFICSAATRDEMLQLSQPVYHRARAAVERGDAAALRSALKGTSKLKDRSKDRGWWEEENWCTLLPLFFLCPGPPFARQKCSFCGTFEHVTFGACPTPNQAAMLEADNHDMYAARLAIDNRDPAGLVTVMARQPNPRSFVETAYSVQTRNNGEMICHEADCYDVCFGADRCDGGPRRICGNVWCHLPFVNVPLLWCPSHVYHYSAGGEGAKSVMQLAADTGEPGLIAATLETDPSRLRMLGKVVIKSMDGTASTITTTPGRIRISELKEKAISEHPRLQGLRPEAFELVSVESPNASTTGVKLTDRFDPVVTQSFRVHDKAAQEVACANADCFDCLLFGACRNNGGGKVRCCGDMCCHPLCIPFLPILRHPILTFSYEREAGDANSLLGLSSSHAEKKALMEVLDERNATHGTLPVGVADAPSELIIVFNQGV